MKKSVILIIGLIYIISVVIVGFIGLQMRVYNPIIYVEDIIVSVTNYNETPLSQETKDDLGCDYYWKISLNDTIEVTASVIPENATNDSVDFYKGEEKKDRDSVSLSYRDNIAQITFNTEDIYYITVKSSDGSVRKTIVFAVEIM